MSVMAATVFIEELSRSAACAILRESAANSIVAFVSRWAMRLYIF